MSILRAALIRTGTLLATLAVVGVAAGGVAGVQVLLAERAESLPSPPRAEPQPVRVVSAEPKQGYAVTRRFTGRVAPAETTEIAFEAGGRIDWLGPREGDRVEAGAAIARLDIRSLQAERDAAIASRAALEAQAELARLTMDRQADLQARGHSAVRVLDEARLTLAGLEAQIAAAAARIAGLDVALDKAVLRAPFAAEIGRRHLDAGATVGAGTPVATLLSLAPAEIRAGLPPELAASLRPGDVLQVEVQGERTPARLIRLRPDLSSATRTREAVLAFEPGDGAHMPYGESATVLVTQEIAADGLWLPVAALRDGPRGTWAVMVLAPDGAGGTVVRPEAVEVLHAEPARVYLRGALPPGTQVVAEGAHRFTPGQPASPLPAAD